MEGSSLKLMKIFRKILKWISIIVFVVSSSMLIKLLVIDPKMATNLQNEIKDVYYFEKNEENISEKFKKLSEINSDIKGWLFISGTIIDYPVLQSLNDSEYYINHNYKKEPSRYGSIFISSDCKLDSDCKNIIIHGHSMKDGTMFADLLKFSDLEFYKKNPIVEFDTSEGKGHYKIVSVFKINTLPEHGKIFDYLVPQFNNSKSFRDYIEEVRKRSLFDIPVDVNEDDKIITLSTCSYEFKDFRTVIVARKVRDDESRLVDTENVKYASNPLMPDCWYRKYSMHR